MCAERGGTAERYGEREGFLGDPLKFCFFMSIRIDPVSLRPLYMHKKGSLVVSLKDQNFFLVPSYLFALTVTLIAERCTNIRSKSRYSRIGNISFRWRRVDNPNQNFLLFWIIYVIILLYVLLWMNSIENAFSLSLFLSVTRG